jgi:hypothetical protein
VQLSAASSRPMRRRSVHLGCERWPLGIMGMRGLEGIVSKQKDSAYRSGRSREWVKKKNPDASAATREAEEDWS